MLQRLIGLVVTAAGVVLALVIGFGALVLMGIAAVVAACIYVVRTRRWHRGEPARTDVIEGEFEVVENNGKSPSSAGEAPSRVRHDDHDRG